jgi:hypothetical protein
MSPHSQTLLSSSQFKPILDTALREYEIKTGNDLSDNWLAKEIQSCDSVEAVLDILQDQANAFDMFRNGDKRLMKWIRSSVDALYTISSTLGTGVGIVRTIRDDLRCLVTSVCSGFLLQMQSLLGLVSSSLFVPLCSLLSTLLMLIFYRQQRMTSRATMSSSTSLSAFNSSSSALGFILRSHRPRIWLRYLRKSWPR